MADRYLPKYVAYHHGLFLSSPKFQRGLKNYIQRHMYRTLCLEAPFCNTRPYLPTDDATLMLLADVPEDVWKENKDAVMGMFTLTDNGYEHHRITEEYGKTLTAIEAKSRAGRASAAAKQASTRVEQVLNGLEQNSTDLEVEEEREEELEAEVEEASAPQDGQAPTQTPHAEPCMRCNGPCYLDGERKIHCLKCHALQTGCKCKAKIKATAVSSTAGSRRKVGFDPWSVAPFDGWTAAQIKLVVDWHWGSDSDPFWRGRVRDEAFFKKHFETMSGQVPAESKKPAVHTTPKFQQEEI
jgi:uncharacterized protein YdaU (DUF1376 family)